MEERIFFAVFAARCAAHDHNRRFFRIRAGDRVQHVQTTDAIGNADEADSVDARIGVGRGSGCRLMRDGTLWIFDFSNQENVGNAKSPGSPKLCRTPRR